MKSRGFEIVTEYKEKNIRLPQRKTVASAGYDIESAVDIELFPHKVTIVPTGIKAYMQENEYLGIHIRSGFSIKKKICLINSQGVIDADYYNNKDNEGHIMIAFYNHNDEVVHIDKGERIAQGVFYQYLTVDDDISNGVIRKGGMGSTGER
ncbi:dUTP diphosphatase [Anaerosinus sp.]|mgnify:CR=1 FL=1|uniref:dUTP diphosphatase n=1 Tax=Selenobaculum sp. TaxID=3074374 RepID=UPI0015AE681F